MKNKMKKGMIKLVAGVLTALTLATTAATPAFAASKDTVTDRQVLKNDVAVQDEKEEYNRSTDEVLDKIAAIEIKDSAKRAKRDQAVESERSLPNRYGLIKRYLMQVGPNKAFILGIYFVPSPIMYEVIHLMEIDVEEGNRAYIYNGKYYESPDEDPKFYSDMELFSHK